MSTITALDTFDIRFPTSLELDGSDAMNPDPDYSAAYLTIRTDAGGDGHEGHGFVFTIGRGGNEVEAAAIEALRGHVLGRTVEDLLADMGATWKLLAHDSQLRWLGPEKGVMHMAIGAVVNALWDLKAKRAGLPPLWELLAGMTPDELVALVDFRYLTDALTPRTKPWKSSVPQSLVGKRAKRHSAPRATPPRTPRRRAGWVTATRN